MVKFKIFSSFYNFYAQLNNYYNILKSKTTLSLVLEFLKFHFSRYGIIILLLLKSKFLKLDFKGLFLILYWFFLLLLYGLISKLVFLIIKKSKLLVIVFWSFFEIQIFFCFWFSIFDSLSLSFLICFNIDSMSFDKFKKSSRRTKTYEFSSHKQILF